MQSKSLSFALGAAAVALVASNVQAQPAVNVLSPNDTVIAIDSIRNVVGNTNTGAEGPASVFDGNPGGVNTKWFSAAREFGGLIVTPAGGPAVVQSLAFTSANDSPNRDPITFQLFGMNGAVTTVNNGTGREDPWTFIGLGNTGFATRDLAATVRNTTVAPVNITNGTAYASYKVVFPALRLGGTNPNTPANPNGIQINEVQMFNAPAGGGSNVALNPTVAIAIDQHDSAYPPTEGPQSAIDGNPATKYLNFGREGTGLIITPAAGSTTVGGLQLTTANDTPGRDPSSYELYGRNGAVTSLDNSDGADDTWTLISSGLLNLPDGRGVDGEVVNFANGTAYTSYKLLFPTNKTGSAVNSIQFAEVRLFAVPEPSSLALVGLALGGAAAGWRRRKA
jgi:hypothetical protein